MQWARVGDAYAAFEVGGSGPDVLEIGAGAGLLWAEHALTRAWPERMRGFARFTSYDGIGTGRADALAPGVVPSVTDKVNEAQIIMDAAGIERAVVVANFASVAIALALAAENPAQVSGLVLVNGFARLVRADDFPAGVPRAVRDEFERQVADHYGTGYMVQRWLPEVAHHAEVRAFMERYEQALARRGEIARLTRFVSDLDVRNCLGKVQAPVTIIHARDNEVVPVSLGRDLHERLPQSRFVEVATSSHLFTLPPLLDVVVEETRAMATGERTEEHSSGLAALVMTDIVGSTERVAALHDATWRTVLADHHQRAQETVQRFGGRRVNTTGDGLLALFPSTARAVRCASALAAVASELGLVSRAGVHVGDVEHVGDDVAGLSVHITSRLLDHAPPGAVVVSQTAADAAIGAGIRLTELGVKELRGVPGRWPLFLIERA